MSTPASYSSIDDRACTFPFLVHCFPVPPVGRRTRTPIVALYLDTQIDLVTSTISPSIVNVCQNQTLSPAEEIENRINVVVPYLVVLGKLSSTAQCTPLRSSVTVGQSVNSRHYRQRLLHLDVFATQIAHVVMRLLLTPPRHFRYHRPARHLSAVLLQAVEPRTSPELAHSLWLAPLPHEDLRRAHTLAARVRRVQPAGPLTLPTQAQLLSDVAIGAVEHVVSPGDHRDYQRPSLVRHRRRLLAVATVPIGVRPVDEVAHVSLLLQERQSDH